VVAKQLEAYVDRERIVRPLVRIDQDGWPLAAGVILQLQKSGVPVAVEPDWIPMFTPAFAATGREAVVLAIDGKPQHVRSLGKPGDVVVIAGKGADTEMELADRRVPFDDRQVVREVLA
jgi:hypothetical protein